MRHTPEGHDLLQYSCLCQYLIKQNATAINIQSLSTKQDEKEILIIPFAVFRIIRIKRNYLDDSTASISLEIELEECEDQNESESNDTSKTSSFSSTVDDIKDVEEYQQFKKRKYLLCSIIGLLVLAIILALNFIFIFIRKVPR